VKWFTCSHPAPQPPNAYKLNHRVHNGNHKICSFFFSYHMFLCVLAESAYCWLWLIVLLCLGGLIQHQPVKSQLLHSFYELIEVYRLADVAVGAELVTFYPVSVFI